MSNGASPSETFPKTDDFFSDCVMEKTDYEKSSFWLPQDLNSVLIIAKLLLDLAVVVECISSLCLVNVYVRSSMTMLQSCGRTRVFRSATNAPTSTSLLTAQNSK